MQQEDIFKKELTALISLGRSQGNHIGKEQVEEAFPNSGIDDTKIQLIFDYLEQNKIFVEEEFDPDAYLSKEDQDYLSMFLDEIQMIQKFSEKEKEQIVELAMHDDTNAQKKLVEMYLAKVIEIAKLYVGQGVLIEDLIGEGNVALISAVSMLSCVEDAKEVDGFVVKILMDAMEVLISKELDAKELEEKVLSKVNQVADAAEVLYHDVRRKLTIEEVLAETEFTKEEIIEAMKFSGNQIDTIEIEDADDSVK